MTENAIIASPERLRELQPAVRMSVYRAAALAVGVLSALYVSSLYNYLLFHVLAEFFSIVVACSIFVLAWNSRRFLANSYLLFIGIAYLFVAGVDLLHALAYKGMGVFSGPDANLATQLWIAARYLQSISLLVAPLFLGGKVRINNVFLAFSLASVLIMASIFYLKIFPDCYIAGMGLTTFKIVSEYVICLILGAALYLLMKRGEQFDEHVLRLLIGSIALTIASELCFTLYVSVFGFANLMGHFLKIAAFFLIYKALVETGFRRPYDLLFRELELERAYLEAEISQRKRIEEALNVTSSRLSSLIHNIPDVVNFRDLDRRFLLVNKAFEEFSGVSEKEVIGKKASEALTPEMRELFHSGDENAGWDGKLYVRELSLDDGIHKGAVLEIAQFPILDERGNLLGVGSISRDISERKRAEDRLKLSIREKEVLLQEIHHRVKNNLAVIHSLLNLQAGYVTANQHRRMFEDASSRVRSMALAHEMLYQSKNLAEIEIEEFVDRLVEHLFVSKGDSGGTVKLKKDVSDIQLGIDSAIPLGFLLTELVTNCLKHAFPDRMDGEITVSLHRIDDGRLMFTVSDNGIGMPEDIDLTNPRSLGLDLVDAFVQQLRGEIEIVRSKGTSVRITFSGSGK
jgi:PAS domain S-box-containing protein